MPIRQYRWLAVTTIALCLSGCVGIKPGESPSVQFSVDIPLKEAYQRAMEQTQYCLVTHDKFPVISSMDPDEKQAQIQVVLDFRSAVVAQVDMRALGKERTEVDVIMSGVNVWNSTAVRAMQAAIQFGVPSCIDYFPNAEPAKTNKK